MSDIVGAATYEIVPDISGFLSALESGLESALGAAQSVVDSAAANMGVSLTGIPTDALDGFGALTGEITSDMSDAVNAVESATSDMMGSFADLGQTAGSDLNQLVADAQQVAGEVADSFNDIDGITVTPLIDQGEIDARVAEIIAEIEAVTASVEIDVPVNVDTSQAEEQISGLGNTATEAAGSGGGGGGKGIGGLSSAIAGFAAVGTGGAESAGGLAASIGELSPAAVGGTAAIVGLAVAADKFFNEALQAEAAGKRFDQTFGTLGSTVQKVDLGGVNTTLGDIALSLGSDDDALKQTLSSFGQMGQASGASAGQVAKASNELGILAARAVALNPALGSVDTVASSLATGLARGGRFAAQYGLSLTSAEINARALADTGKESADQLTQYEKAAAGAAIATERYGDSLKSALGAAGDNPVIQLAQLKQEFSEVIEAIGGPLVAPIFDLLRDAQPLFISLAELIGGVVQAALPLADVLISALSPLVTGTVGAVKDALAALTPVINDVSRVAGELLGPALDSLGPLFDEVVIFSKQLSDSLDPLIQQMEPLAILFGQTLGGLAEGAAISLGAILDVAAQLVAVILPLATGPLQSLVGLAASFGLIEESATKAGTSASQFGNVSTSIISSAGDLANALKKDDKAFADTLFTTSEFAKAGPTVVDALRKSGVSAQDLRTDLGNLDTGFKDFTARAIQAGQVKIRIDGVDVSAESVRQMNGTLTDFLNTSGAVVVQGSELVNTFTNQSIATNAQAQAQFTALAAQQALSDVQISSIGVQAQAQFGVDSYATRLLILAGVQTDANARQAESNAQQAAAAAVLQGNAAGWTALVEQIAAGAIGLGNVDAVAATMGVSVETAKRAIQEAQTAVDDFVSNALTKFPTALTVFDDLKNSTNPLDPTSFTNNLMAATAGAQVFQGTLDKFAAEFPETVALLQEKGPVAAGAFAQAFATASPEVRKNLEDAIRVNKESLGSIEGDIRNSIVTHVDAAAELGHKVTASLGAALDFGGVTKEAVADASNTLSDRTTIKPLEDTAQSQGDIVGVALSLGVSTGIISETGLVEDAARNMIKRAQEAAKQEADAHSPSRVFAALGSDLTAGLAVGMGSGVPDVVNAAESIVRQAAAAMSLPVGVVQGNLSGGLSSQMVGLSSSAVHGDTNVTLHVTVQPPAGMTTDQARALGGAIGDGIDVASRTLRLKQAIAAA